MINYKQRMMDFAISKNKKGKKDNMEEKIIENVERIIPQFVKIARQMWIDYDKEADVLYINFEKPQNADDSVMDGNIIVHKRANKIVGLTIVNASKFRSN